jgi:hypothetical protein
VSDFSFIFFKAGGPAAQKQGNNDTAGPPAKQVTSIFQLFQLAFEYLAEYTASWFPGTTASLPLGTITGLIDAGVIFGIGRRSRGWIIRAADCSEAYSTPGIVQNIISQVGNGFFV